MLSLGRNLQKQRPRRVGLLLLALFRLVTVLFAMQFSGLVHGVSDLVDAVVVAVEGKAEHEHEHCPPDRPCEDCPPGCPNCHCGVLGALVPESPLALLTRLPPDSRPPRLNATEAPIGPELPSLFRPPRA